MFDENNKYLNKIKNKEVAESVTHERLPGGLYYPAIHADFYEELESVTNAMLDTLQRALKDMDRIDAVCEMAGVPKFELMRKDLEDTIKAATVINT